MTLFAASDPRHALDRLIRERGGDYSSLSRLIGRNSAYIQQFIKRGVPRKLDEDDRRTLARYFGVSEQVLGGPQPDGVTLLSADATEADRGGLELMLVPMLETQASAGPGSYVEDDEISARIAFRSDWLRELTGGSPAGLSVIRVRGDSMTPTLADGDEILVDRADTIDRLRDGIYVLRIDDMLNVKRIAMNPAGGGFEVRSDNPVYPVWANCDPGSVAVIGRVVWAGRRIS